METVVVGVDRPADSRAAVLWAVRHAHAIRARLVLVHAFDVPDVPLGSQDHSFVHDAGELAQAAQAYLEELATELGAPAATTVQVVRGRMPARCLLDAAADADLLVVGSRRRGGLTRLVLGSVSQQCVQHAACPVVVVPAPAPAREPVAEPLTVSVA